MQSLKDLVKKLLPRPLLERIRRRRAVKHYLRALSDEVYDRNTRLDLEDLEGRIAARRDGFYERLVRDVLERTELILQELDRRIEAVSARHGNELRELRHEIQVLREVVTSSRDRTPGPSPVDEAPPRLAPVPSPESGDR